MHKLYNFLPFFVETGGSSLELVLDGGLGGGGEQFYSLLISQAIANRSLNEATNPFRVDLDESIRISCNFLNGNLSYRE